MSRFPMTVKGKQLLEAELKRLVSVERPLVVQHIEEARALGDLKENADYHAWKERQGFLEGRIQELNVKISNAEVIDPTTIQSEKIVFGATVTMVNVDTGEEVRYQIVGEDESDVKNNLISVTSPIAKALISKSEGDEVEVKTPGGVKSFEIDKVEFI